MTAGSGMTLGLAAEIKEIRNDFQLRKLNAEKQTKEIDSNGRKYKWFAAGCIVVGSVLIVISAIGVAIIAKPEFAQSLSELSASTANSVNFLQNRAITFLVLSGSGLAGGLSLYSTAAMSLREAYFGIAKYKKEVEALEEIKKTVDADLNAKVQAIINLVLGRFIDENKRDVDDLERIKRNLQNRISRIEEAITECKKKIRELEVNEPIIPKSDEGKRAMVAAVEINDSLLGAFNWIVKQLENLRSNDQELLKKHFQG